VFKRFIPVAVADDPREPGILSPCEGDDSPGDIVGRIDAHESSGTDEIDLFGKPFTDRHGEVYQFDNILETIRA